MRGSNGLELGNKKDISQDTDWFMQGLVAMAQLPLLLIFCVVVMCMSCPVLLLAQQRYSNTDA